jgi:putative endonuclease
MRYWVYIMAGRGGTLYVGATKDLKRRVQEHTRGTLSGFASKYKVTRLVYYESALNAAGAFSRERQIKRYRRQKKLDLINSMNPRWEDLVARASFS